MNMIITGLKKSCIKTINNIKFKKNINKSMAEWLYQNSTYQNTSNPCIYVVLLRSKSIAAKAVEWYKHDEYTHAAISLSSDLKTLYSFGRKWANFPFIGCFRKEDLTQGFYAAHDKLPGIILKLKITEKQYFAVLDTIVEFINNKDDYRYNFLGFFGNMIGVGIKNSKRYTCSEFVAYVLQRCGIMNFNLSLNLIRPQMLSDISDEIVFKGDLKQYVCMTDNEKIA